MSSNQYEHLGPQSSPLPRDAQFQSLCADLSVYGLTTSQSRIYVHLLGHPVSPVRVISGALGLHRVDVYRNLRELESLGVVETIFSVPRTYSAISPEAALSALLQKQEEKLNRLNLGLDDLAQRLGSYGNSLPADAQSGYDSFYRVLIGRSNYYAEMRKLLRNTSSEVLRLMSPVGLVKMFSSGVYEECIQAKKRGISVRILVESDSQNRFTKRLSRVVRLRLLHGEHPRFVVADRTLLLVKNYGTDEEENRTPEKHRYLAIRDKKMAGAYCYLFERLWKSAKRID